MTKEDSSKHFCHISINIKAILSSYNFISVEL